MVKVQRSGLILGFIFAFPISIFLYSYGGDVTAHSGGPGSSHWEKSTDAYDPCYIILLLCIYAACGSTSECNNFRHREDQDS